MPDDTYSIITGSNYSNYDGILDEGYNSYGWTTKIYDTNIGNFSVYDSTRFIWHLDVNRTETLRKTEDEGERWKTPQIVPNTFAQFDE